LGDGGKVSFTYRFENFHQQEFFNLLHNIFCHELYKHVRIKTFSQYVCTEWARIAYLVYQLTMGWTVCTMNPGSCEIFHACTDRPLGPPSLLYIGYQVSFLRVDHPLPSSSQVKERLELHLNSSSGLLCPVLGWTIPLPYLGTEMLFPWRFHMPHISSWAMSCLRQIISWKWSNALVLASCKVEMSTLKKQCTHTCTIRNDSGSVTLFCNI
jgi:hypothetical protein